MTPLALRPWVILALIFVLGGATGSLLTIGFGSRFAPAPPGPQEMRRHWMEHLTHRLNLTDDQQARIRPILIEAEAGIQSVHREDVGQISEIMKKASDRIAAVLDPGQQAQLRQMEQERERMFSRHLHGPGSDHGPGGFHDPDDEPPPAAPGTPPPPES